MHYQDFLLQIIKRFSVLQYKHAINTKIFDPDPGIEPTHLVG